MKTGTTKKKPLSPTSKKASSTHQLVWGGIALAAVGTVGYLGWRHFKKKRNGEVELFTPPEPVGVPVPRPVRNPLVPVRPPKLPTVAPGFPLRKGSRGTLVKQLQQALIDTYGRSILPRWGADGVWGNETQNALVSKGLPTTIQATDFQRITGKGSPTPTLNTGTGTSFNPSTHARSLINAIGSRNFSTTNQLLGQMKSVTDYSAVNETFRNIRLTGVRHTLVTALFKFFPTQRDPITQHLLRMGLKYNGRVWSLSGLGSSGLDGSGLESLGEPSGASIVTIRPTAIWDGNQTTVEVPANVVLGHELESADGFTRFQTLDNHELMVHTHAITYAA